METSRPQNILVLGSGNFGTCLSLHLSRMGHNLNIYTRDEKISSAINKEHRNPKYLSQFLLPHNIKSFHILEDFDIKNIDFIIIATPTQTIRSVFQKIKHIEHQILIIASKGIEIDTEKIPHDIITDLFGEEISQNSVTLSGPSFASEIAEEQPTGVTIASKNVEHSKKVQKLFHTPYFRVYTSQDPIGLEISGAIKNVIAIAAGACFGLGLKQNAKATLITRGLAEITRFGLALGAQMVTFKGLGGVGDLFLTCTSEQSRNFRLGFHIGKGEDIEHILKHMGSIAEGYDTAKSAYALAKKINIDSPIVDEVYHVLYQKKPVKKSFFDLISRDAKSEFDSL